MDQLSQAQVNEYRDVFAHFSKGQPTIDNKTFPSMLKALGEDLSDAEINAICPNTIDADSWVRNRQDKWAKEQSGEEVKAAFTAFDLRGDGTISAEDLRRVMTTMGEVMSNQEVEQMLKDAGGSSSINYRDFVDKMKRKT